MTRNIIILLTDAVCLIACWAASLTGYQAVGLGFYASGLIIYLQMWPVIAAFLIVNAMFRLYHGKFLYPAAPISPVDEMRRLFLSSFITHVGVLAALALMYQTTDGYSRAVIAISGILVAALAQPARDLVRSVMFRSGTGQIPVFLAAGGSAADKVLATLANDAYTGFRVVRTFREDFREIVPAAKAAGVKVLIACQDERLFKAQLEEFTTWFTFIEYLPTAEAFPIYGAQPVILDAVGGMEMVNQRRMRGMRFAKSVLDFSLSVAALVCLSPFFIVLPILIKLTSRGPVFYRANRLGKNGRQIRVWKFRSMYADADARLEALLDSEPKLKAEFAANFKLANDPRVTPFGRFLRKTSLDEIPQLFNVFSGEMALIGPRPIVEKEVAYYGKDYAIFASVKPGITGLWQASGRSDTNYARRVALDTHYVLNWSPWLDLWILKKTVSAVLFMRGAC